MIKKTFLDKNKVAIQDTDIEKHQDFYVVYEQKGIKCEESYLDKQMSKVNYYTQEKSFLEIINYHLDNYPKYIFSIFFNEKVYFFDNQGIFLYFKITIDKAQLYYDAEYNKDGLLNYGQIIYFKEKEKKDLLYAFEFGQDKQIFNCFSFEYGGVEDINSIDKIIVNDVLKVLEEVEIQIPVDFEM